MSNEPSHLIDAYRASRLCLADWRAALGAHYDEFRPLLRKAVGEIAFTYPSEVPGIRYTVGTRNDRFMGFIPADYEDPGIEDCWFTVEDVQLWHFDDHLVAEYQGAPKPADRPSKPVVRVLNEFKTLVMPDGSRVSMVKRLKRRIFLRLVDEWCREHGTDQFYCEEVIEDHNKAMDAAGRPERLIRSDRLLEDLFRSQQKEFLMLFDPVDKGQGIYRLKVDFERSDV